MSELKVYVKPIKTNMFGKMIVGQSYYLKSEADKVIAEKDQRIKELTPHWVRLSDELPTTYGPHLVIFQNGKGGCLSFNVETKSFQVEEPIQWWADAKYIFGDWTAEK